MTANNVYGSDTGVRGEREGRIAKAIEKRTAKIPSDVFLWAAGGAILGSFALQAMDLGRPMRIPMRMRYRSPFGSPFAHLSLFVGQWAPTFLLLGVYNKLVKTLGSQSAGR